MWKPVPARKQTSDWKSPLVPFRTHVHIHPRPSPSGFDARTLGARQEPSSVGAVKPAAPEIGALGDELSHQRVQVLSRQRVPVPRALQTALGVLCSRAPRPPTLTFFPPLKRGACDKQSDLNCQEGRVRISMKTHPSHGTVYLDRTFLIGKFIKKGKLRMFQSVAYRRHPDNTWNEWITPCKTDGAEGSTCDLVAFAVRQLWATVSMLSTAVLSALLVGPR